VPPGPARPLDRPQKAGPVVNWRNRRVRSDVGVSLALAAALIAPAEAAGQARAPVEPAARHVVLISIDGLRPEFYLDATWPAPMLQQMAGEGAHARAVRSVFPAVTLAAHTTIVTGALPARHGIVENRPFEPGGPSGRWYMDATDIQVPTLWSAARAAGLESANVAWPVSLGAPIDRSVPAVWPQTAASLDRQREAATPAGLVEELERMATGRLSGETFLYRHRVRDDHAAAMAAYLLGIYRPALLTVHLLGTDTYQHAEGREGAGVRRAVAAVDRAVSRIVEAAERAGLLDRTAFVVTGDHGFSDMHVRLAPNAWLVEAGLHEARPERGEWRAAFHSAGGTALLYLRDPDDSAAVARVREILSALPAGQRRLFSILEAEDIARFGGDPLAALAIAAEPGVVFNESPTLPAITPVAGGTHGYPPNVAEMNTGLVAWGAGIRPRAVAATLGLEDVAPLVAALLGIELEPRDGVLPAGLLQQR
jgi:predicted AlkP superfamily pyrophosphatase or phosphodiesterase